MDDENIKGEAVTTLASGLKTTAQQPISSTDLEPSESLPFVNPNQTPVFPVGTLELPKPPTPTPSEKKAEGFTSELEELNKQLLGETSFRAKEEEKQGIPGLIQAQTDLSSRLGALQREALAIPLQLQQESEGRGITEGGLRPLEAGRVRENAIQSLGVASLLEANQGRITSAEALVDRAAEQQFGEAKARKANALENLDILIASGQLNRDETRRAEAQKAQQQKELEEITRKQETQKAIGQIAITAAANGGDSNTLSQISGAENAVEATRIAAQAGLLEIKSELDKTQVVTLKNGNTILLNTQTGEIIKSIGGAEPKPLPGGVGTISGSTEVVDRALSTALQSIKFSSVTARKDAQETLGLLLSQGDVEGAKQFLGTQIRNSASAAQQDTLDGKENTVTALERIQDSLDEYIQNGGETGFFTGKTEKQLQRLGRTLDPELARIVNDISLAIIDYRRAVSGAAFTESEAAAYEAIFPSAGKLPVLNNANINSIITKMEADRDNFYKSRIGERNFNQIFNSVNASDDGLSDDQARDVACAEFPSAFDFCNLEKKDKKKDTAPTASFPSQNTAGSTTSSLRLNVTG